MNILLESDFITTNLKAVFSADTQIPDNSNGEIDKKPKNLTDIADWSKELQKRKRANNSKPSELRKSEYDIETELFTDFFTATWQDDHCVKQLLSLGGPLRNALRVLGFEKEANPFIAFLLNKYVRDKLLKTKLINKNTFEAFYKAIAGRLVADTQLLVDNNYNIIYCPDLYTKSAADIMAYIKLQAQVLKPEASKYTAIDLDKNKKIFLQLPESSSAKTATERAELVQKIKTDGFSVKTSKLNELDDAKFIKTALVGKTRETSAKISLDAKQQSELLAKLDSPAKRLAALQYIALTIKSKTAKAAIKNGKFDNISASELLSASIAIAEHLPKNILETASADALVTALLA